MRPSLILSAALLQVYAASPLAAIEKEFGLRSLLQPLHSRAVDENTADYYLGYRGADYNTSWAKFYNDTPVTYQDQFTSGLDRSPVPASAGLPFADAGVALSKPGYLELENGYTILKDGTLNLAIQTYLPADFTGEQLDFWFSWHINDTTKYKLWNPAYHQYAAVEPGQIAGDTAQQSYRSRYYNLTSFVDEYIGDTAYKLSIAFFDPTLMGFSTDNAATGIETIVTGFVQTFVYAEQDATAEARREFGPIDAVLAHQVRKRPDGNGMEMRSRFWFGGGLVTAMRLIMDPLDFAHDLSVHCATEMTHLGTFLPALFEEFKSDVPTAS